jgi:4-hydroxy-tetrahydrodipicolinate synthase
MQLTGVIPANILPLNSDLTIDEQGYRAHLDALVEVEGVTGLTCNGHAAEVSALDRAERRRAVAMAVETVAGRVPVVCGIFADDEHDALQYAGDAQREGADALLLFPPNSLAYDEDPAAAYRYFSKVAAGTSLPIVAFRYPRFTNAQYDAQLLARICSINSVVALKEWSLDIAVYERSLEVVRSASHPISLLTSFSTHLLPALAIGADGILSGHGSVIAALQAELFAATSSGDLSRARQVYARVQHMTKVVYRDPMPNMYARMKEQLAMLGYPVQSYVRPPLRPVSDVERESLRQSLISAGLLSLVTT